MTRVSFYVLGTSDETSLTTLACRIAGKAREQDLSVHINTGTPARARLMDERLWTFSQASFLPHILADDVRDEKDLARHPIVIGVDQPPPGQPEMLVNLATDVPSFFSRFERVAEIVDAAAERREAGRERFRFYRDRGYALDSHNL